MVIGFTIIVSNFELKIFFGFEIIVFLVKLFFFHTFFGIT